MHCGLLQVPFRQHLLTQLAGFLLLLLADIARCVLQNASLAATLANAAAQLLLGVIMPSLVLRQLDLNRSVSCLTDQGHLHAKTA